MSAEYGYDDSRIEPKTCPLTGEKVWLENNYICFQSDCSQVSKTQGYYLYGRTYRCKWERHNVVEWHDRQEKAAEVYKRLNQSLETARKIDIDEFYAYCDSLDTEMISGRQRIGRDMMINPYHDSEEKCLIYLFENDEVVEISTVENPFSYISARFEKLQDESRNCAINICAVPAYMAEAINVRLHLQHNMDVKAILHTDNPVYIKARNIGKYIDAAYGWNWLSFKRVRDKHLEMTEIVNYDNIIYIKQELDEIVRREYPKER